MQFAVPDMPFANEHVVNLINIKNNFDENIGREKCREAIIENKGYLWYDFNERVLILLKILIF